MTTDASDRKNDDQIEPEPPEHESVATTMTSQAYESLNPSMTKKTKKVISMRWSPEREWLIVAYGARPHLAAGCDRLTALRRGQQLLPRNRRANLAELTRRAYPSALALDRALVRLQSMSPEEIAKLLGNVPRDDTQQALLLPPPVETQPYLPRNNTRLRLPTYTLKSAGGLIKWEPREWALLTRRTRAWQAAGSNAGDVRCLAEAQEIELPAHRRRPYNALSVHAAEGVTARLAQAEAEWMHLIEHIPYDPLLNPMRDKYETLPQPVPEEEAQDAPVAEAAPTAPPEVIAAPLEAHRPLLDKFWDDSDPPPPVPPSPLATSLAALIDQVLASHEQMILARVREDQQAQAKQLAADMTALLVDRVDRMLGGSPVAAAPPIAEGPDLPKEDHPKERQYPTTPPDREHPRAPKLKVDVVGFEDGQHRMLVQRGLSGLNGALDLRFVHPDSQSSYTPNSERQVILLRTRVPHAIREKIDKAGCQIHLVRRTVPDVISKVTDLVREYGK